MRWLVLLTVLAGCPRPKPPQTSTQGDAFDTDRDDTRRRSISELQDQILASYERDEPAEVESLMIPPRLDDKKFAHPIGPGRIGVGPGDALFANELERAPSRWPLDVAPLTPTTAHSKRLELHLSLDGTAAWAFDEISWRIGMCGRTAVIPLRMTGLYARDGDRWVMVFEHVSFGHMPSPLRGVPPKPIATEVIDRDLADTLSRKLSPVLLRKIDQAPAVIGTGAEVMLLGPDLASEWHGPDVLGAKLVAGNMKLEDRRVGVVGHSLRESTIAYWIGNMTADLPARPGVGAGKAWLRATFVFEYRRAVKAGAQPTEKSCAEDTKDCEWVLVLGQVSEPINDEDLANTVFGTALISPKPLQVTCDDGSRAVPSAPRQERARPAPQGPAARTP
jgi:hypothetical protein